MAVQTQLEELMSLNDTQEKLVPRLGPGVLKLDFWESPLGKLAVASDKDAICWLSFTDGEPETVKEFLTRRYDAVVSFQRTGVHEMLQDEIARYFDGQLTEFKTPIRLFGTEFQRQTWAALQTIPYGQTLSYSDLATRVGVKNGQRAVGKANGDNPVSILVPCHRVIRSDGDLCGYAGGLWRKQRLLAIESGQPGLF